MVNWVFSTAAVTMMVSGAAAIYFASRKAFLLTLFLGGVSLICAVVVIQHF